MNITLGMRKGIYRVLIIKRSRVIATNDVSFDEKFYPLLKCNQSITFQYMIEIFVDAHDDVESHSDDASGTADTLRFQPEIDDKCHQDEASIVLENGNKVATDDKSGFDEIQ